MTCVRHFKHVMLLISTHTLTWSVTYYIDNLANETKISTHTLTWSVTFFSKAANSNIYISTHTLTWSVTVLILSGFIETLYFNSHAHVERDLNQRQ